MHVLLIEPDADEAALASALISGRFPTANIDTISTATAFATALTHGGFDVVVTEHRLSWAEGPALLRAIGQSRATVPVVFFTHVDDTAMAVEAMQAGAAHYLVKSPRSYLRLPLAVHSAVTARRPTTSRDTTEDDRRSSPHQDRPIVQTSDSAPLDDDDAGRLGELTEWVNAGARILAEWGPRPLPDPSSPPSGAAEPTDANVQNLIAQAAHELDAPLRMIAVHAGALTEAASLDAEARESLNLALAGVGRMQELVDDFAEYGLVWATGITCKPCDCNDLVDRIARQIAARFDTNTVEIHRDTLPTVQADRSRLIQVFDNLLSNAVKFRTETPARVEVSAQELGEEWIFSVRDEGIGVERDRVEDVFVLFRRLHPEYPGTGVGLAICKRVVEQHGGRIWIRTNADRGSTVRFTLPKRPTPSTPSRGPTGARQGR